MCEKKVESAESRRKLHTCNLLLSLKQIGTICLIILVSIFSISSFADNITTSPADCTQPTLLVDTGTANLTADWEANKIGIEWYSDNVKITGDASAATQCTYDQTFSLPTPPTKTGYNFVGWKVMGVPDGYTRLKYIQSNGTQYIDTGINQNTLNFQVNLMISYSNTNTRYTCGVSSSSPMYFGRAADGRFEQNQAYTSLTSGKDKPVNLQWGKDSNSNKMKLVVTIEDQSETLISNSNGTVTNNNFVLIGNNIGSGISTKLSGRIYFAKIYKNGELVFYGIPAKNSSDVIGMYDAVSKTFFTNAGTGTFAAGPVMQ